MLCGQLVRGDRVADIGDRCHRGVNLGGNTMTTTAPEEYLDPEIAERDYVRRVRIRGLIVAVFVATIVVELWIVVAHLIRQATTIRV
jgi:hypothetical protein